ncbi:MAG: transcriptional repressor [Chloroflexi bacterium]|nr:transcriptional repressor [Chloroflexota bacterium]
MSCEKKFIRCLRSHGFRLTPQREMVLSVLHEIEGFATAEEIYQRVQALSASVDISTVYRTLDLLQGFHLVAAVEQVDGQRRYELLGVHGPHLHMVCRICGEVMGADLEAAQALAATLEQQYGFQVDVEQLGISGICPSCRLAQQAAPIE